MLTYVRSCAAVLANMIVESESDFFYPTGVSRGRQGVCALECGGHRARARGENARIHGVYVDKLHHVCLHRIY